MIIQRITKLGIIQPRLCLPFAIVSRSRKVCPIKPASKPGSKPASKPVCNPCTKVNAKPKVASVYMKKVLRKSVPSAPVQKGGDSGTGGGSGSSSGSGSGGGKGGVSASKGNVPVRLVVPGKCRMGFIPDEWFQFFSKKTGVSGPYFLMLGLANYCASKEILVMEHEYYSGLSVLLVLYLISTKFGAQIGAYLDKQVDEVHDSFQKVRDADIAYYKGVIKDSEDAQIRAKGQKELMAAKKENIAVQLEAVYRERVMAVYKAVKNRMIYQIRKKRIETRMDQWWLIKWVVKSVHEAITPEFRKRALQSAIRDLDEIANRIKK